MNIIKEKVQTLDKINAEYYNRYGQMDIEKIKEIIIYFVFKQSRHQLSRVKLMKLVFLSDVLAFKNLGRTITGFEYYNYKYGPWTYTMPDITKDIPQIDEIKTLTQYGDVCYRYKGKVKEYKVKYLKDNEFKIIENVNEKYSKIPLKELLEKVYNMVPFKGTSFGKKVDFKKIATQKYACLAKKHKIPLSQAEWTEEKALAQIKDYKKGKKLSELIS